MFRLGLVLTAAYAIPVFVMLGHPRPVTEDAARAFPQRSTAVLADAVAAGDVATIDRLVQNGEDPNASGEHGRTLLEWAITKDQPASFQALIADGADVAQIDASGNAPIHMAATSSDGAFLGALLARHVDVNSKNPVTGATPLVTSIYAAREDRARDLLAAGANPNLADHGGNTALHVAAMSGDSAEMLMLLGAGADARATNRSGATFQTFASMTPPSLLNDREQGERAKVGEWLSAHGLPAL